MPTIHWPNIYNKEMLRSTNQNNGVVCFLWNISSWQLHRNAAELKSLQTMNVLALGWK